MLADNVAFAAFAAARHAAAWLLLTADLSAVQQSIDISWPPGPQQQTRSSRVRRPDWTDGQRDGRTDGRTPDSCISPALHTMRAVQKRRSQTWLDLCDFTVGRLDDTLADGGTERI